VNIFTLPYKNISISTPVNQGNQSVLKNLASTLYNVKNTSERIGFWEKVPGNHDDERFQRESQTGFSNKLKFN
jgi:hypothetical protein